MTSSCREASLQRHLVQSVVLCLLLAQLSSALYIEISSDLRHVRGTEGISVQTGAGRILLQAATACSSPVRKCTINGSPVDVQPSVYDTVSTAQNCTASFGGVLCGGYLLDAPLHAAILAGACDVACEISQPQGCPAPPAIFTVIPQAPAPAPGPACAPEPEPGCGRWEYVCSGTAGYRLTERQYAILENASTCAADLDPSYCFAGRSIVEVGAYNAVKNATCQKQCLEGGLIQACPASLLGPAPGPGSNLAYESHQEYVLPNGTLSRTYQKGARALPAGALDSALQTGAPPRHPPENVPQALSSEYAGAYGGYGRPGAYGGYGGRLRKPDSPPSGLAAQSLSDSQVAGSDARYLLQLGPSGECSVPCSGGTRQKTMSCIDTLLGLPIEMTMCSLNSTVLAQLSEPCNTQRCSGCYWNAGDWGTCSALCGNGTAQRTVQCLNEGLVVPPGTPACSSGCQPALKPQAERSCAVAPCISYLWQTGSWSSCRNGKSIRTVQCIDTHGGDATDEACIKKGESAPRAEQLCGNQGCSKDSDCMGAGRCNTSNGTCACAPGFAGPRCAISLGPCNGTEKTSLCCSTGVVDRQGTCCSSGLVSEAGTCCTGVNATLDSSGACCNGKLDACGLCNGSGQVVDFTGSCCVGAQDAGGLCCPLPSTVDEFGVCGGKSNSGISVLNLKLSGNHTSGLGSSGSRGFAHLQGNLAGEVAARLGVNASQVLLRSVNPATSSTRHLLLAQEDDSAYPINAAAFSVGAAIVTPTIIPIGHSQGTGTGRRLAEAPMPAQRPAVIGASVWLRPPYRSGSYASLASQLSAANVSAIGSAMQIQGVQGLSKIGVKGNGKCEIGELPTPDNAGAPVDCALTFHNVPNGANGQPCSGHGAAIYAQGTCQCYTGYNGDACEACGDGHALAGGLCQRTLESFLAQAALAGKPAQLPPAPAPAPSDPAMPKNAAASLAVPLAASLLGCLALLALIAIVLLLFARHRRRSRRDMPAQKKADALPITVDARAPQQAAAPTAGAQGGVARPSSHAIDVTADSATTCDRKPSKRWSFFSARSGSHTSAGQVAPSPHSAHSDSGSSVSSASVESARRRSAMGSMTLTHSTTLSHPSNTTMRPTYTVTDVPEAQGLTAAPPGSTYYDAEAAPDQPAEPGFPGKRRGIPAAKGKGSDDRGASPSEDLKAHAVALSDCSEMSYAGSPMSAGSSQTHNPGASSIPEEHEVLQQPGADKK